MRPFAASGHGHGHGTGRLARLWIGCLAAVLGLLLPDARGAAAVGGVKVIDDPVNGALRLSVVNSNLAAVTMTVTVTPENAVPSLPNPIQVTCPGRGIFPFVLLEPREGAREYGYRVRYDWQFGLAGVTNDTSAVYRLPFARGRRFVVVQGYGGRETHTGNNHYALDFEMPVGTPVHAARDGVVEVIVDRFGEGAPDPRYRDRVNMILVRQPDGTYAEYVHLLARSVRVRPGQRVRAGDLLAKSGNSGFSHGPHLHFAVFQAVDGVERTTHRIRFLTEEGAGIELEEGRGYTAR